MKAIRLHLKQNSANYRREETINCRMTYPLPPYSTVIGAIHKACGYTDYHPMKVSIQGKYGSQKIRLYRNNCFHDHIDNDRSTLVKMRNPDMLSSAYDVVAIAPFRGKSNFIKKTSLVIKNSDLLNEYVFYSTKEMIEIYKCHDFSNNMPEYISIGNDNGDWELVIKATKDATLCGFLDAGSIGISDPDEWFDFRLWINEGCKTFEEDDNSDLGKVYIIKSPKEKLKFLAETKRIFSLNISTGLLYKKVNNLPYVIMEDIYISKADTYIEQTSFPGCYEFRND